MFGITFESLRQLRLVGDTESIDDLCSNGCGRDMMSSAFDSVATVYNSMLLVHSVGTRVLALHVRFVSS